MSAKPAGLMRLSRPAWAALCAVALLALSSCSGSACFGFNGCFDDNGGQTVSIVGTAATGRALASAVVRVDCVDGSASTVSDAGGNYAVTVDAVLPCVITASSGGATLHSLAFAGGTFNTTPETELMLVYLAAQLGTDTAHLVTDFPNNGRFQQALESEADVSAAQAAVVTALQQHYSLTLTTALFLTTPFTVGQTGVDTDLNALAAAGAIDTNGMPNAAAVSLLSQAGAAHPL